MDTKRAGIYRIRNLVTGGVYIGSSRQAIRQRWNEHRCHLEQNKHQNPKLQNSWNKHGKDAFAWEVIENVEGAEHIIAREQYWLDQYFGGAAGVPCYNIYPAALDAKRPVRSAETRARMSAALRGRVFSAEHRVRLSESAKGRGLSAESRRKISEKRKGLKPSDEVRAKLSARQKGIFSDGLRKAHAARMKLWAGFVSPDGTEYRDILNLTAFAAKFGLDPSSLAKVYYGKLRHHRGWRRVV